MQKIFTVFLTAILLVVGSCSARAVPAVSAIYELDGYTYEDMNSLSELISEQQERKQAAHSMAEAARQLGYSENHEVIVLAHKEWNTAHELENKYQSIYNALASRWHEKEIEYPAATYIWTYFKNLGYSNQVCAGILGNIMAETGGQTLDIQYWLDSSTYYGMCQWSKKYFSDVIGADLDGQCAYLEVTIRSQINTFGSCYKKNFNYEQFCGIINIEEAALAFAKTYERCAPGSHYVRKQNAVNAYNYFVS